MPRKGKAEYLLKWILEQYPDGFYKVSVRGVPYLRVNYGTVEIGIAYFGRHDSFRLFPDVGEKWDIKTKEEVVAYLKGEQS